MVLVTMMIGSALSPPAMCGHGVSLTWVVVFAAAPSPVLQVCSRR